MSEIKDRRICVLKNITQLLDYQLLSHILKNSNFFLLKEKITKDAPSGANTSDIGR
jgi:hypothetical protein